VTRTKKVLAWFSLLGFALTLRIGLAVASPNIFFPDEIFQTLEPAHRLVYGYGVISWEWRMGIRSWVFPAFLAGVMRATAWLSAWFSPAMRSGSAGYLLGTVIVLSLISLTAVWFGYAWAKRASGTPAAIIAAVACSFYFGLVYFAPKALTEVVAAHVMLPGLYLGVYGQKLGERKRLFLAGLFCGLAACLRIQLLPALIFAMACFCYPEWRKRTPLVAAGASAPVLLFGAVDWITWSYPWQSFIGNYAANVVQGPGKEFSPAQPWYWYLLVLLVLIGPAVLLLFHGARRSPFLAIFCAIVVVSHSAISHKETRYIYPILAPAITLAAMGIVDLLDEIARGTKFLHHPKWVGAIGVTFFLLSSALLTAKCADWYKTRWGVGAFDRLSREASLCGVGIYDRMWWESGGYTHLHRDVPIVPVESSAQLAEDAPVFNALIAPRNSPGIPAAFTPSKCWSGVCLLQRAGTCAAPAAGEELNAYLRRIGR
jgi:GPI mannosyltransferase 3